MRTKRKIEKKCVWKKNEPTTGRKRSRPVTSPARHRRRCGMQIYRMQMRGKVASLSLFLCVCVCVCVCVDVRFDGRFRISAGVVQPRPSFVRGGKRKKQSEFSLKCRQSSRALNDVIFEKIKSRSMKVYVQLMFNMFNSTRKKRKKETTRWSWPFVTRVLKN